MTIGSPVSARTLGQELEPLFSETAERVRRAPRLEGAPPQSHGPGGADVARGLGKHVQPLRRARSGDDRHRGSSHDDATEGHASVFGGELAIGQLIGLHGPVNGLNARNRQQGHTREVFLVSDAADHRAVLAAGKAAEVRRIIRNATLIRR